MQTVIEIPIESVHAQEQIEEQPQAESVFQDVAISEAATMKADGKDFTAYTIRVQPGFGFQPWTVKRRFR